MNGSVATGSVLLRYALCPRPLPQALPHKSRHKSTTHLSSSSPSLHHLFKRPTPSSCLHVATPKACIAIYGNQRQDQEKSRQVAKAEPQSDYLDLDLTFRLFLLSLLTLFFLHLSLMVNGYENKIEQKRALYILGV